ncbi:carboxymuconolactone decarboxylase family protein [Gallaecimonas mangrovi]|uniref:carboxymuconolactone decarboxylase family protein n=1 Tax=Gallaecimonas mangrovi TaxID=2291597 RepID=UPI000E20649D|nr:carboxymuconolactone decarboxylase family protein [Gallaecimonas mangrovi]
MRMNYRTASPEAFAAMMGLGSYLEKQSQEPDGIDKPLLELVKIRVSQLNHCAFCLDMHTKAARMLGETEQRLYTLSAWREAALFSDREKAALAWAEANTCLTQGDVSDALYHTLRQHFSAKQLTDLTLAIAAINAWNRFGVSFRTELGKL